MGSSQQQQQQQQQQIVTDKHTTEKEHNSKYLCSTSCSCCFKVCSFLDSLCNHKESNINNYNTATLLLQGLVMDVAIVTSCRHAALSCAHHLADARPRFIGRRSVSTVLSQVCLGRPVLRLHSTEGS